MNVHTIEDNFDHQVNSIFDGMKEDYESEQESNKDEGDEIQTFSEWLWNNRSGLGDNLYDRIDEYLGLDEFTESRNFKSE